MGCYFKPFRAYSQIYMTKGNKAKKFIITHQFTQPADLEYQTSVTWGDEGT